MAVKQREYLLTTNRFKEPEVATEKSAIGLLLTRLLLLEPGTNPLHPEMGVGIRSFRYGMDNKDDLQERIEDQLEKFLPYFSDANVTLIYTPDHTLNVEITIENTTYVYESATPIGLSDIADEYA